MTPYRFLPHTADIAVELLAQSERGLYEAGVAALRELLVGQSPVARTTERPVALRGQDPTERLIHFLGDLLYAYDTERFVPAELSPTGVYGEPFDPARHDAQPEVKAVTHHGARVETDGARYRATLIFDV